MSVPLQVVQECLERDARTAKNWSPAKNLGVFDDEFVEWGHADQSSQLRFLTSVYPVWANKRSNSLLTCVLNFRRSAAPVSLCGRNAVQIHERARPLDLQDLAARLIPLGAVRANEFALRFETPPYLLTVFPDGRAIIKGTTDVGVARSLYARYIGA
jgi:hypothetical protein